MRVLVRFNNKVKQSPGTFIFRKLLKNRATSLRMGDYVSLSVAGRAAPPKPFRYVIGSYEKNSKYIQNLPLTDIAQEYAKFIDRFKRMAEKAPGNILHLLMKDIGNRIY